MSEKSAQTIELIPVDRINVLNPRLRNKRSFENIITNISALGLKKPVTVTLVGDDDGPRYDLACGQGRLEAYLALGQTEIPALVIRASHEDCLVRSLVENCARRRHSAVDLFQDIGGMKLRGYSEQDIARKTGLSYVYVRDIGRLIEKGEHRLLKAVESGQIPVNVAVQIAEADDAGVQTALRQAYEKKILRGRKLMAVKRILEQRRRRGKGLDKKNGKREPALTPNALLPTYRQDADRKRMLIRKAGTTRDRLVFVTQALRTLLADENFINLLRAEGLHTLPRNLAERIPN